MNYLSSFKKLSFLIINFLNPNYDNYVAYRFKKKSLFGVLKIENIKFIRSARIKYWHKKVLKYSPFLPFFSLDKLKSEQQNTMLAPEVRDIYRNGSSFIEDALSQKEIDLINIFADSLELKSENNYVQVNLPSSLYEIRVKLLGKLNPVIKHFFPNILKENRLSNIYVGLRIDYSFDGIDSSPQTANWHVDRFIPTINAVYFPNGSRWGEFEKDFGCPLITKEDINYYINDKRKAKRTPEEDRDKYYVKFKNRNKRKFSLKKNTMYIGSHHMQHRRSPINTPGKRIAIFIDTYNFFTRKDI